MAGRPDPDGRGPTQVQMRTVCVVGARSSKALRPIYGTRPVDAALSRECIEGLTATVHRGVCAFNPEGPARRSQDFLRGDPLGNRALVPEGYIGNSESVKQEKHRLGNARLLLG